MASWMRNLNGPLTSTVHSLPQKTADKRKKEMAKQKASPETRRQKLEAEPPVTFKLFVGNLNFDKTAAELKTGLSEFFAKNLTVVSVSWLVQADAERALDEKRGTKIGGLAVVLGHVEEKSQGREGRGEKPSTWRMNGTIIYPVLSQARTLAVILDSFFLLISHFYLVAKSC
ncbi:hypothetical protein GH733_008338 [Mirounga leonina]|nr:hypothetical protein GH733_008338 [Mirounga leonina]